MAIGRRYARDARRAPRARGMRRFMRSAARSSSARCSTSWDSTVAARGLRRRAAAAGDRGTVADLGREPVRSVRADRGSRCADQRPARAIPCPGDVGTPAPGWELRIAESGELQIRGDYVFEEYLGQPEATRDVRGADGWLRTGDIGEWQDRLRLLDRARDFIVTAGGKTLSPSYIENILRASPVAEVAVFGHARKYLTALIEIDFDTVSDWARSNNIPYSGFTSLASHAAVGAAQERNRARERAACASRTDQGVPHPAEGARSRRGRRADHAHAQGEAQQMAERFQGARRVQCTIGARRSARKRQAPYCTT